MSVSLSTHTHHRHVAQSQQTSPQTTSAAGTTSSTSTGSSTGPAATSIGTVDGGAMPPGLSNLLSVLSQIQTGSASSGGGDSASTALPLVDPGTDSSSTTTGAAGSPSTSTASDASTTSTTSTTSTASTTSTTSTSDALAADLTQLQTLLGSVANNLATSDPAAITGAPSDMANTTATSVPDPRHAPANLPASGGVKSETGAGSSTAVASVGSISTPGTNETTALQQILSTLQITPA